MLEDIAIQYVGQTEIRLQLISYLFTVAGAIVAAIFHKSDITLQRSPYFAYSCILIFIAKGAQFVWLDPISAAVEGFLWVLMLNDLIVDLAIGYTLGIIAMARSRDAYGHARKAFLAFIPVANLWLFLARSKDGGLAVRSSTPPLLTGRLGVLTGCALFIASFVLGAFFQMEAARMAAEVENSPTMGRAVVEMRLRSQGVEKVLGQIAAEVPPQKVDETTDLLRVEGIGTTLRYTYEVSTNPAALPATLRTNLLQEICTREGLRPLIEAGATIDYVFDRTDGSEIGVVSVTRDMCGF